MRLGLKGRMVVACSVLAVLVCGVFAALVLAVYDLRDDSGRSRHSQEVLATAAELERAVLVIQSAHRGYAITEQESFLESWHEAREAIPVLSSELTTLVADNPAQAARAQLLAQASASFVEDHSAGVIELTDADPEAARDFVAGGSGRRLMSEMVARFDEFGSVEAELARDRDEEAAAASRRALALGVGGAVGILLIVVLLAAYMARVVVAPVRRAAAGALRIAAGDFSERVPETGKGETAELGRAFNAMAASLESSRSELEAQNAELELQTAELERQQVELEASNDELEAQHGELERALDALAAERDRLETAHAFGDSVARETELRALTRHILDSLADFASAEIGALYGLEVDDGELVLLASRGLDPELLPATAKIGEGLAGRALVEERIVEGRFAEAGLRLPVFGADVAVKHELHVPLIQGGRRLGVLTLARAADKPFSRDEVDALGHLGIQAAVGLSNTLALRSALRENGINRAILDATTEAIVLTDLENRIEFANRAAENMYEILGIDGKGTVAEMSAVIRERTTDPEAYWAAVERVRADPDAELLEEYELVDGPRLQRYTAPVRDSNGDLLGRLWVLRDVSSTRDAERLKTELVSTVSHELRTPLAGILGFAELLVTRDVDPDTRKRYVETIHGEAARLTELVNDFLDLQRIEAGRFELRRVPFELGALLRNEAQVFVGQSAKHSIQINLPGSGLDVLGERERVAQVVANLLSNAIKYSPEGGEVELSAQPSNGTVRVSIADNGIGIPEDQQSKVFEKFFRVDSSDTRSIGGTGLGLALCREIVNAHGGRIGFTSVEGKGSVFWFELPAVTRVGSGSRVLVVEDDPTSASLLADMLSADGFQVELAAAGEDALERAFDHPPAAVCLDIELAGKLDGWKVLARLKESARTASVPVVICTGGNGRDTAWALGAADFLTKPFSATQLRETLARVLPDDARRVLVVDDDENVRALVVETLAEEQQLELREAADGMDALDQIARERPDAVVLDLAMPKMDGFAVLRQLREDDETRAIPVIVLTAMNLTEDDRDELSERAVALLHKSSYSSEELRLLVRHAVGRTL